MRTTVGPLPPEVYWRRRLALIGVLVIALIGIRAVVGGDSSSAGDQPTRKVGASASPDGSAARPFRPSIGTPGATPTPSPSATSSARSTQPARPLTGPCADAELSLTAAAVTREYPVGTSPKLVMTVRNVGTRTCVRDLGPVARELIVTSGPAHTWSTDDCHAGTTSQPVSLKPGASQSFTEVWDGRRSQPKCRGGAPVAAAGTYRVQARLGSLRSDKSVFRLT